MSNYVHYRGYPIMHVPRWELEAALWRCSKRDRELVLSWYDKEAQNRRDREAMARRDHQTYRDLEAIVKDQRAHIANLEAELLPHLAPVPVETEAML